MIDERWGIEMVAGLLVRSINGLDGVGGARELGTRYEFLPFAVLFQLAVLCEVAMCDAGKKNSDCILSSANHDRCTPSICHARS